MGQLVLGLAGAAIGSVIPGVGTSLGYGIGSAIGAVAFSDKGGDPQRVTQPLIDLKVVGTEYGQPIPWVRGRVRTGGQLWWNSDRRAITTVTRSGGGGGGKGMGGGPPEQESESTVYEMDALYGLTTDNGLPIDGDKIFNVARIWDNGKLIWTNSTLSQGASIAASNATERWRRLTVYTGAADQMPDPTYEAAMILLGKAPIAYRQRGSVFIEGLQLGASGAVPNLTFEVLTAGDLAIVSSHYWDADDIGLYDFTYDGARYVHSVNIQGIYIFDTNLHTFDIRRPDDFDDLDLFILGGWVYLEELRTFYVGAKFIGANENTIIAFNIDEQAETGRMLGETEGAAPSGPNPPPVTLGIRLIDEVVEEADDIRADMLVGYPSEFAWGFQFFVVGRDIVTPVTLSIVTEFVSVPAVGYIFLDKPAHKDNAGVWWMRAGARYAVTEDFGVGNSVLYRIVSNTEHYHVVIASTVETSAYSWIYDPSRDCIYFLDYRRQYLKKFDCATQAISTIAEFGLVFADPNYLGYFPPPTSTPLTDSVQLVYDPDEDRVIGVWSSLGGSSRMLRIHPETGDVENDHDLTIVNTGLANISPFNGIARGPGVLWGGSDAAATMDRQFGIVEIREAVEPACYTVAEVQAAICDRAGLREDQYDVTALSSITRDVCCFPWSQVSPSRAPTELLMSAYYYEVTVSDKIYFRPRGGAHVATIEYEELGAVEGAGPTSEPLALRPGNDLELVAQMALDYANLSNDYQTDTQYSDRMISATPATLKKLSLNMGFEPGEAKAIINTMLRDQVVSMVSSQISVLGHRALLEPTDVILVMGPNGEQFRFRIVKTIDAFPLISGELVLDDASILQDLGITSLDYDSQTDLGGPVDTILEMLDIPILRDADNDAGFYLATKGTGTPYSGSAVYKSPNDINFERIVTINESAIIGVTTTALGDWTGPRVFDYLNSVTVDVGRGVLTSSTRELVLVNSVNAMLIGDEIIQFLKATAVGVNAAGDPIYKLTGLLRGSRGTEWAMVGHSVGERVVLLRTAGLRRHALTNAELGVQKYYKGVTLGRSVASVDSESFTGNGVGLKPFSPWNLRADRDGSNNITLTWDHRSRLQTRTVGPLGVNIPLGEVDESYEVDIYDGVTVVRTIVVSAVDDSDTPSAIYTAAQQVTDGLTPGDPVTAGVYQISDTVGRGYEHQRTV